MCNNGLVLAVTAGRHLALANDCSELLLLSQHHAFLGPLLVLLSVEVVDRDVLIDDLSAGTRQQLSVVCAIFLAHEVRLSLLPRCEPIGAQHVEELLALLLLRWQGLHV